MSYASVAILRRPARSHAGPKTIFRPMRLAREVGEITLQSLAIAATLWLLLAAPGVLTDGPRLAGTRSHVVLR